MQRRLLGLYGVAGFALFAGPHAAFADSAPITTMQGLLSAGYDTYVSGNMGTAGSAYTSDSQAPIAAGGNVYLQSFGASTNATANGVGLAVGGNLTLTYGSVNGTTDVAGNLTATSTGLGNVNVGGSLAYQNGQIGGHLNVDGNATVSGAGVNGTVAVGGVSSFVNAAQPTVAAAVSYVSPIDYAATSANVAAVSKTLAGMASTAGDTFGKNASGAYVFNSTAAGDNIFNVTAAQLSALSANQVLFSSNVAGATAIVNVTDTGTISLPGNLSIGYTGTMTGSKVLLNIANATTVDMASNVSYDLSIMAPNATLVTTGGNIAGSVFAANLVGNASLSAASSGGGFSGALPSSSLPAPGFGWVTLGLTMLAGAGVKRRSLLDGVAAWKANGLR